MTFVKLKDSTVQLASVCIRNAADLPNKSVGFDPQREVRESNSGYSVVPADGCRLNWCNKQWISKEGEFLFYFFIYLEIEKPLLWKIQRINNLLFRGLTLNAFSEKQTYLTLCCIKHCHIYTPSNKLTHKHGYSSLKSSLSESKIAHTIK